MNRRSYTIVTILFFSVGVLSLCLLYGKLRRVFHSPAAVAEVSTSKDIYELWAQTGIKGRTAIMLTRHLNAEHQPKDSPEEQCVRQAMQRGMIRKVFHIVPDNAWQEISATLMKRQATRKESDRFVLLFEEGRVTVMPLSKLAAISETSIIVLEPGIWKEEERVYIQSLIASQKLTTDLMAIIRGSKSDSDRFRGIISQNRK